MMAEIISDHTLPAVLTFILGVIVGGVSIGSFLLTFSPLSAFTSDRPSRPNLIAISTLGPSAPRPGLGLFRATACELCEPDAAAVFIDRAGRIAQSLKP